MFSKLGILKRHIISNLIDIGIPLVPIVYSYCTRDIILFDYLTFFEVFSIVFLITNLLFYLIGKGNTIGEKLTQIDLIFYKSETKNHAMNIIRIILIAGFIFLLRSFENFDYTLFLVFILLFMPIKFVRKNYMFFSIINNIMGLYYIPKEEKTINEVAT
ncbi:MAG: hypothetical protein K9H48_05275 [Melioribacteraceae bacterium]|nr:hypothetical protein [Melioribacteraceae bacterium]MCF8393075.1 hypothetical protein [Melioribacteraceae bacterium]MCF8419194.1 hypothetical protein [Melioribacteraceae bacterium]